MAIQDAPRRATALRASGLALGFAVGLFAALLAGGCSESTPYMAPMLGEPKDAAAPDAGGSSVPSFPTTGIDAERLTVTGIDPASGPYTGGTVAILRGSGFTAEVEVRIGGALVQPRDTTLQSRNRVRIVVPAAGVDGVGDVDVTVTRGDDEATLEDGFRYNGLELSPTRGSASGGTQVEIGVGGYTFDENVRIEFGGAPCTDLKLLSPTRVRCKTPRHDLGSVDVVVSWPEAQDAVAPRPELVARAGYEFIDTIDAELGGLSGGPIDHTLNVAVMNDLGFVIPGALVLVGNDVNTRYRGLTDERGTIVFSGDDLRGPVTVHASAKCYQRGSIVSFDAENATIILSAAFDLSCAAEGGSTTRRGTLGSMISGELVFPGAEEFGVNDWRIVPDPRASEVRVAYVFTTRSNAGSPNPSPDPSGTIARIIERTAEVGTRGYKYKIFARPAGLAVYALAGLERTDTGVFTPYVMGLARNVVTAPGEENEAVDVVMDVSLDRELSVSLLDYPKPSSGGPSEFLVRANVDLGGEGVIVREVGNRAYDTLTRRVGSESFRFFGQPAFSGLLADASYEIEAGYYAPDREPPLTMQRRVGVPQNPAPIELSSFLGIPRANKPATGGMIPSDRMLRFDLDGPAPDLIIVDISDSTGFPVWTEVLPGDARAVPVPDLSSIKGQSDLSAGFISWTVTAVKIDDFRYNEFRYAQLSARYYTHTAINVLTARR